MNGMQYQVLNPLQKTIEEGEDVIRQLINIADELETAIANERTYYKHYQEALATYEMAETDELGAVVIAAQMKEGPLAGVPVSGKGYDLVLGTLKNSIRRSKHSKLWTTAENCRRNYEDAKTALIQVQERFNALRKVADLKAAILRATTI